MTPYTKQIVELHKIHKAIENCGCNKDEQGGGDENSGSFLIGLIPNNYPKPDLFVSTKFEDGTPDIDVTNYDIDDLLNLLDEENSETSIICLYESSNLNKPIISEVRISFNNIIINFYSSNDEKNIINEETVYNNKTYYVYYDIPG